MARAKRNTPQAQESVDQHHGHGGSYVNTEAGTRELVERTEDRVPRSVEQEEAEAKKTDEAAE